MRRSISAPVNLQSSQLEQIEGGPSGPVRIEPGSPEYESNSEGETSSESESLMIILRQLIAMPLSVLTRALSWFGFSSEIEIEEGELKEETDNSMAYTSLLTACLMIILLYKKFR